MRAELVVSIGIGLAMIGAMFLVGLVSRRSSGTDLVSGRSSRTDLGSVSGEWIAEQTRLDIDPQ